MKNKRLRRLPGETREDYLARRRAKRVLVASERAVLAILDNIIKRLETGH